MENHAHHVAITSGNNRAPKPGDADYQPDSAMAAKRMRSMIRDRITADSEVKVDGSVVELGPEFADAPALSISEARFVTDAALSRRRKDGKTYAVSDIMRQMQNHMDIFARFLERDQLQALEQLLAPYTQLNSFEKSQLTSLVPGDHEEAKTLIPSLVEKIDDEDLDQLLSEISAMRKL